LTPTPPRLLLAEDSEDDIVFIQRAFKKAGLPYPLEVARDGVEVIERLSAGAPAITHALLDLKMPRKNGLEVLEWIRSRPDLEVRAAILTSSRMNEDVVRAYGLGADLYLVKPSSTGDLTMLAREMGAWVERGRRPNLPESLLLPRPA